MLWVLIRRALPWRNKKKINTFELKKYILSYQALWSSNTLIDLQYLHCFRKEGLSTYQFSYFSIKKHMLWVLTEGLIKAFLTSFDNICCHVEIKKYQYLSVVKCNLSGAMTFVD